MTELASPAAEIGRDRYGRPLVKPRAGGKPVGYQRVTKFADLLEDRFNLERWQQRQVITGLVDRPDLIMSAAAHRDDDRRLDAIAADAQEAAKAHAKATIGTALHALCEQIDRGYELGSVPADYRADLAAYTAATAELSHEHIEQFVVLDDLKVAGTPDRISTFRGRQYITDIKTGRIDYGQTKIAIQLALYAHGELYDPATGKRSPLPEVDRKLGIVIHLPAGEGTAQLLWVDIERGWSIVPTTLAVKDWRNQRGLIEPIGMPSRRAGVAVAGPVAATDDLFAAIGTCTARDQIEGLWSLFAEVWTNEHTIAAKARIAELGRG